MLPTYRQMQQSITDYHQFIFEVALMANMPQDEVMTDFGTPLRFRFRDHENQQPELITLQKNIEQLTDQLDEFYMVPSAEFAPKSDVLGSYYKQLNAEITLGRKLLSEIQLLVSQFNNNILPAPYLDADTPGDLPYLGYYRALRMMNKAMEELRTKVSHIVAFYQKHTKRGQNSPHAPADNSIPSPNVKAELLTQPFLTKKEAALVLGVSEDTIDNYIKRDMLAKKQVKGKKKILISVEDIKKLIP